MINYDWQVNGKISYESMLHAKNHAYFLSALDLNGYFLFHNGKINSIRKRFLVIENKKFLDLCNLGKSLFQSTLFKFVLIIEIGYFY